MLPRSSNTTFTQSTQSFTANTDSNSFVSNFTENFNELSVKLDKINDNLLNVSIDIGKGFETVIHNFTKNKSDNKILKDKIIDFTKSEFLKLDKSLEKIINKDDKSSVLSDDDIKGNTLGLLDSISNIVEPILERISGIENILNQININLTNEIPTILSQNSNILDSIEELKINLKNSSTNLRDKPDVFDLGESLPDQIEELNDNIEKLEDDSDTTKEKNRNSKFSLPSFLSTVFNGIKTIAGLGIGAWLVNDIITGKDWQLFRKVYNIPDNWNDLIKNFKNNVQRDWPKLKELIEEGISGLAKSVVDTFLPEYKNKDPKTALTLGANDYLQQQSFWQRSPVVSAVGAGLAFGASILTAELPPVSVGFFAAGAALSADALAKSNLQRTALDIKHPDIGAFGRGLNLFGVKQETAYRLDKEAQSINLTPDWLANLGRQWTVASDSTNKEYHDLQTKSLETINEVSKILAQNGLTFRDAQERESLRITAVENPKLSPKQLADYIIKQQRVEYLKLKKPDFREEMKFTSTGVASEEDIAIRNNKLQNVITELEKRSIIITDNLRRNIFDIISNYPDYSVENLVQHYISTLPKVESTAKPTVKKRQPPSSSLKNVNDRAVRRKQETAQIDMERLGNSINNFVNNTDQQSNVTYNINPYSIGIDIDPKYATSNFSRLIINGSSIA